ncbi:LOB domain-containing protein 18 [Phtheirospermum japonicum]|uniref:LOB domain-containing protein 18 n=1 Tax=Phtheirospermum japonicum TaxID=374723 RepID=A0A830BRI2_9LAMI|nr:LOB domain-containing protein 18 [Phtheirospermum japonicum]
MKCHNGNEKQEVHCLIEHVCSILTRSKARRISRRCTRCLKPATCRSCCSTSRRARDWTQWSQFATRLRRGSGTRFTVVWLTSLLFNNK